MEKTHSKMAITSFVLSILSVLLFAYFLIFDIPAIQELQATQEPQEKGVLSYAFLASIACAFVALGNGIKDLFQKDRKRLLARLGVAFSSVIFGLYLMTFFG